MLAKKARRLLVPYAFVCLVWAVPWWVALFGPDRVAEKYVLGDSPSQLWFLLMLFWVFAMFEGLHRMAPGLLRRKGAMAILCLALYALGLALGKLLPLDLWQVESALQYCLLFWVGYAARGADTSRFWRVPPWGILAADLALCAGWACLGSSGLPGASLACAAALPFVRVAGALAAVSALGHLPALLERLRGGAFERGSFQVYLFHQQVVWLGLLLLNRPGVSPLLVAAGCFALSLAGSMAIARLLDRWPLTRRLVGK